VLERNIEMFDVTEEKVGREEQNKRKREGKKILKTKNIKEKKQLL
jgi:hypothetical protein